MPKYHVHVYAICRVKVWNVEAESQEQATQFAYDRATDWLHNCLSDMTSDEPPAYDQHAQFGGYVDEVTGFLVDEDGDDEYRNSREYDQCGKPIEPVAA